MPNMLVRRGDHGPHILETHEGAKFVLHGIATLDINQTEGGLDIRITPIRGMEEQCLHSAKVMQKYLAPHSYLDIDMSIQVVSY